MTPVGAPVRAQRYTTIAIILHWAMALLIAWQIWIGLWMGDALENPETQAAAYDAFQFHKSLGLTLLILAVLRLLWRLSHRVPSLPAHMPKRQKSFARLTHGLFYAFMILVPLTGWLYVSTGWNKDTDTAFSVPTVWFGLFEWPHIPGVDGNALLAGLTAESHEILAFATIGLFVLHVAAALKHHFADKDLVLWSMLPFLKRPDRVR